MDITAKQRIQNKTELWQSDVDMKSLQEYISLLKISLDRYEYLKESGVPDAILYTEKGLIDQQLMFFSRAWARLTK